MSNTMLVTQILDAIREVIPEGEKKVSLHEPLFAGNEWKYVKECIDTGWVSSVGEYVTRFEQDLARITGARYAIATSNGTAALHVCLKLVGVRDGDEVLTPALSFVATANAITYCNAIPHLIDSDERSLGVDAFKLREYLSRIAEIRAGECFNRETGRRIRAVVPMHTFGHPVDLEALAEVCSEFCLEMIEDAAEALGSYYKGKHVGQHGRVSALSFNGNKIVTTGGGGAILTQDVDLAKLAKHLTTTAKVPHPWEFVHDQVGYNYRMPNLNAAMGCAQLEKLPEFLNSKRKLTERYRDAFSNLKGAIFFVEPEYARSNYWLNAILLEPGHESLRDVVLERTNAQGILTRPIWTLMHRLPMHRDCPRMDLSQAESLEKRVINLPSSAALGVLS
jgi:perosamine synthetase